MRLFDHYPTVGAPCPICGTNDDKLTTLVPIAGTEQGNNMEAMPVHVDCIVITAHREAAGTSFFMFFVEKGQNTPPPRTTSAFDELRRLVGD